MNRLVLIDGNAVLHRAYHAIPPLTDPDGVVVNAVYGFATILLRLVHDLTPTHIAVAFDRPKPTFRKELYKEYQATRPKMDDDLVPQIDRVHEMLTSMNVPMFEMDGFEADDVIGTIAEKLKNPSFTNASDSKQTPKSNTTVDQIIIVTGDRDILQLVEDEKVLVYMPTKGLTEAKLYGEKDVVERMGVTPAQIADFKALAGDASDNYPGVEGIGPKTAVNLIAQTGSVMKLYELLDGEMGRLGDREKNAVDLKISEGVREKLVNGKDSAMMSFNLATIRRNVPIECDAEKLVLGSLDTPESRAFLESLRFHSLIKRMSGGNGIREKAEKKPKKETPEDTSEQQQLF